METPEHNKVADFTDLRQSPGWAGFLESLGWETFRTKNGVLVGIRKSLFGGVAKVQRPKTAVSSDLEEIDQICKKARIMFVKFEPALGQNLEVLEDSGYFSSRFPLIPPSTIFIDLTKNEPDLWKNISRSGKYSIKRARREGVKIETYQRPSEKVLEEFCLAAGEAAKFKGFLPPILADVKKKVELFGDKSYVVSARDAQGELMAANFYLGFGDCVWFLHGGTSNKGREGRWGHELLWQSFLHFKGLGYKALDLEGRDDPRFPTFTKNWGGFSHFKEKFGGTDVQFPEPYIKLYSPILKLLNRIYGRIPL